MKKCKLTLVCFFTEEDFGGKGAEMKLAVAFWFMNLMKPEGHVEYLASDV